MTVGTATTASTTGRAETTVSTTASTMGRARTIVFAVYDIVTPFNVNGVLEASLLVRRLKIN